MGLRYAPYLPNVYTTNDVTEYVYLHTLTSQEQEDIRKNCRSIIFHLKSSFKRNKNLNNENFVGEALPAFYCRVMVLVLSKAIFRQSPRTERRTSTRLQREAASKRLSTCRLKEKSGFLINDATCRTWAKPNLAASRFSSECGQGTVFTGTGCPRVRDTTFQQAVSEHQYVASDEWWRVQSR